MKRAFTLVELLVVIGIIGILIAVLLGTFSGSTESARAAKCQANMHNLAMAVQSYGMSYGVYPRASRYQDDDDEVVPGWLSEQNLTDPYMEGADSRRKCFDGGAIWPEAGNSSGGEKRWKIDRDSCVCPGHQRYTKEKMKNKSDPLWSYAMNSYFDVGAGTSKQRSYGNRHRSDRFLLFAELPYAKMSVGTTEIQSGNLSGSALDPVLDYKNEVIGFNHKDGKNVMGHVCFADGHVEKLRAPKTGDAKELTQWLCKPFDVDSQGNRLDFDIRFNGSTYEKDYNEATE